MCGMENTCLAWRVICFEPQSSGIILQYVCTKLIFTMQEIHDEWEWQITKELIFKMMNLELNYYDTKNHSMVHIIYLLVSMFWT